MIMLGGAIAGGIGGLIAANDRKEDAFLRMDYANKKLEALRGNNDRQRDILAGNLSLQAMAGNSQNKAAAIQEANSEGAANAALGESGLAGGSAFYKMDSDIIQMRDQVVDLNNQNRINMGSSYLEAVSAMKSSDVNEYGAGIDLRQAADDYSYANSILGYGLAIGGGALSGAQTANSLMATGVDSGLLTEDFLASDVFASRAKPYAGVESYTSTKPSYGSTVARHDPGSGINFDSFFSRQNPVPSPMATPITVGNSSMYGLWGGVNYGKHKGVPEPLYF